MTPTTSINSLQETALDAIRQSYQVLSHEQDLSPNNDKITTTLTHLVRTLTGCHTCPAVADYLLSTPDLTVERNCLPELCGRAECAMEKFWARKFIAAEHADLNEFWYISEYQALCQAEIDLVQGRDYARISFLGAGALPLTAFFLAQAFPAAAIVCVDYDAEACELSRQLAAKVGLADRVTVIHQDATQYTPAKNELVICASLLDCGQAIYDRLSQHSDCDLLVRDSEGSYRFLYKQAKLPQTRFREVSRTAADSKRINTSRYFRPQDAQPDVA